MLSMYLLVIIGQKSWRIGKICRDRFLLAVCSVEAGSKNFCQVVRKTCHRKNSSSEKPSSNSPHRRIVRCRINCGRKNGCRIVPVVGTTSSERRRWKVCHQKNCRKTVPGSQSPNTGQICLIHLNLIYQTKCSVY